MSTENLETEMESKLTIQSEMDKSNQDPKIENTCGDLDAKQKKKLDKLVDNILKKSNSQSSTQEEKYYALIQKFVSEQEQTKKLQLQNKELEKTIVNLNKQRDLVQSDYTKALFAKDKLEGLCRELQKHNKLIKDENLIRVKEEEEKRKEISAKFQLAIDDINKQVAENSEKNSTLMQENAELSGKLKNLLEQYEVRENHIEKVLKHKDLEIQLADAKFQQSELKLKELNEKNKAEKQIFETHCSELLKKCEFHQESEKQLKSQLAMYTEKYEEFQTTLKKSNQLFESFKSEIEKMSKKIKKLEQETTQWKNKWESCDKSLQNVIKQKEELEDKTKKLQNKYDAMEKISRALQTERTLLKEKLKNYETSEPVPEIPSEPSTEVKQEEQPTEQVEQKEEVKEEQQAETQNQKEEVKEEQKSEEEVQGEQKSEENS